MARSAPAYSSFTAGEIGPKFEGRTNIEKYREGLADLTNMIVMPSGGVTRRPGTEFLDEVKDSAVKTRLIPFQFKATDTYILEFGDEVFRIYRNGALVTSGGSPVEVVTPYAAADIFDLRFVQSADTMYFTHPSYDVRKLTRTDHDAWTFSIPIFQGGLDPAKYIENITQANPGVVTVTAHGYSDGDEIALSSIQGMTEVSASNFRVANATTDTFTLVDEAGADVDTTSFTAFEDGGGEEIAFTGAGSTQANPCLVNMTNHPFFDDDVIYIKDVVGMTELNDKYYIVASATTNTFTLKDMSGTAVDSTGYTAYSSGGTAELALSKVQGIQAVGTEMSGTDNRPSVVSFFEQRLVFANTNNNPQTIFFSKNADYQNFETGTADDDALIYTIASNQVNAIRYLSATRILTIGTSGGEYVLTSANDGPITPTSTLIRKYSNYGSSNIEPVQVADVTLFLQRGARKVREFKYVGELNLEAYAAPDMTILAEHLTEGGLTGFAYQQEPDSIIWAIRTDGTLLGLSYRREENIVAWHKHVIGGTFDGGQAVVESIAVLPTDTGEDELYMAVKRTINGTTKRYVERMKTFDFGTDTTSAFFVDSGLTYSGTAVNTLAGLSHLEGEDVTVLANGAAHPDRTVSSGQISMAYDTTSAAVGYSYTSSMQTMRIDTGSSDGTAQGKPKRVHGLTVRFYETVGAEIGNDAGETDRIPFRSSANPMDQGVPLFSGDKKIEFPGGFFDDDRIYVRQDQALPMTVLALFPRLNTFDI